MKTIYRSIVANDCATVYRAVNQRSTKHRYIYYKFINAKWHFGIFSLARACVCVGSIDTYFSFINVHLFSFGLPASHAVWCESHREIYFIHFRSNRLKDEWSAWDDDVVDDGCLYHFERNKCRTLNRAKATNDDGRRICISPTLHSNLV